MELKPVHMGRVEAAWALQANVVYSHPARTLSSSVILRKSASPHLSCLFCKKRVAWFTCMEEVSGWEEGLYKVLAGCASLTSASHTGGSCR